MLKRHVPLPYEWNRSGRLTNEEFKRLKIIFLFVVLACFINPLFVEGAWYPIRVFFSLSGDSKIFFEYIQELQRPITWDSLFVADQYTYYKLLILISFVTFIFNRRRIDISALLFWIVFLIFSLQAIRNMAFFAFAAYLVIVTNIINLSYKDIIPLRFTSKKFQYMTATIFHIFAIMWLFQFSISYAFRGYYDFDQYERKSEYWGVSQRNYPDKAVAFLIQNQVKGNFLNDFNSGAYMLGQVYPDIKVFIDGRTEVYGGKFFNDYREIFMRGNKDVLAKALEDYAITGALLNSSSQPIEGNLLKYFYDHKDWIPVYFDYDGVIFLKNVALNQEIIEKHKIDLKQLEVQKLDLFKLGPTDVLPYRNYFRAYSLESMDLNDAALAEAYEALRVNPQYPSVYDLIGKIYSKQKDYQKAFENFRLAVTYAPNNKDSLYNLALALFDLGRYPEAVKRYQDLRVRFPQDLKAYFFLAKSYIKNQEFAEAIAVLKEAMVLKPKKVDDFLSLGNLFVEEKQYIYAKDVYQMGFQVDKESKELVEKWGDFLKKVREDTDWIKNHCPGNMPEVEVNAVQWLSQKCVDQEVDSEGDSH
jgi:tetratricopeptide (TPR) repeat protein